MRRSKGEGTIYTDKGKYRAQVTLPSGKKASKTFTLKKDARAWLAEQQVAIDAGTYIEPSKTTLDAWWRAWFEAYISRSVTVETQDTYNYTHARLPDWFINRPVSQVTTEDVQNVINTLADAGKSYRTLEITRSQLRRCFATAVSRRLIANNPVSDTKLPKKPESGKATALTAEEDEAFLVRVSDNAGKKGQTIRDALLFTRLTGTRRGETVGLKWSDIKGNTAFINGTKNRYSKRTIPLPPDVLKMIERRRFGKNSEYVFATRTGKKMDGTSLKRWMETNTNHTVHELRHTYITNAVRAGVDLKTLSKLIGHAGVRLLLDLYTHTTEADLASAVEKISSSTPQARKA